MPTVRVQTTPEALDNIQEAGRRQGGEEVETFNLADGDGVEVVYSFEDSIDASRFRRNVSGLPGIISTGGVWPENMREVLR
jgi:hypothetical protein